MTDGVTVRARAGLRKARRKAGDVITATREKGESVIEDTREKSFRAAAETNRLFQEHPIAAVAAAAAAGAVLAIFVPRLAVAAKAGQIAKGAVRAATSSGAAQLMLTGLTEGRSAMVRNALGKASASVGERLRTGKRRKTAAAPHDRDLEALPDVPPPAAPLPDAPLADDAQADPFQGSVDRLDQADTPGPSENS